MQPLVLFLGYRGAAVSGAVEQPAPRSLGNDAHQVNAQTSGRYVQPSALLRYGSIPLTSGFPTGSHRLTELAPGQLLLARRVHCFSKLTLGRVAAPRRKLDGHDRWQRGILITGPGVIVLEGVGELVGASCDVCNSASSHRDSPQILGPSWAHSMCNSNDAVPFDDTHLNEDASLVSAYEHRHRIILYEVPNREAQCMEYVLIRHTMPMCAVEDKRVPLHSTRLLVADFPAKEAYSQHPSKAL
nr:hypothetical protein [Actinomyces oris]